MKHIEVIFMTVLGIMAQIVNYLPHLTGILIFIYWLLTVSEKIYDKFFNKKG